MTLTIHYCMAMSVCRKLTLYVCVWKSELSSVSRSAWRRNWRSGTSRSATPWPASWTRTRSARRTSWRSTPTANWSSCWGRRRTGTPQSWLHAPTSVRNSWPRSVDVLQEWCRITGNKLFFFTWSVNTWCYKWSDVTLLVVVAVIVVFNVPQLNALWVGGGGVTWYYTIVYYWCFSWGDRIAYVVVFYYPTTWAATYRLQRVSLRSWRMDAVKQGCLLWVKIVSACLWSSSLVLVYIHRDSTDCQGQGAQDGHLDLHTAPELQSMQEITF